MKKKIKVCNDVENMSPEEIIKIAKEIAEKYRNDKFPFAHISQEESIIASLAGMYSFSPDNELSEEEETIEYAEGGYFDDNDYYCDDENNQY